MREQHSLARTKWAQLSAQHDQILVRMHKDKVMATHEIQMLVTNNAGVPVPVNTISYIEPDLMVFSGPLKDGTTYILKHPHQVDVTFNVVRATGKPTKLGFVHKQPEVTGQDYDDAMAAQNATRKAARGEAQEAALEASLDDDDDDDVVFEDQVQ